MAGLLAARVLSERYNEVTVVDRDDLTRPGAERRGVPQGRHAYVLLTRGHQELEQLFPGLADELVSDGASYGDALADARLYFSGHLLQRSTAGLPMLSVSRPFLERQAIYEDDVADLGHVSNSTRVLALRADVLDRWAGLLGAIKAHLDPRRYELATLAAARALRSTYCSMAHGRMLRDRHYDAEAVRRIATDHSCAGLSAADVGIMDFADQVSRDATSIGPEAIDRLRGHGLADVEILDVALTAAARFFLSTLLDAVGARADAALSEDLDPPLRAALTVGRPPATD